MKGIYFFSTKLRVYLTELPLIALLVFAIIFNDKADTLFKLYPLITALILGIIFIFIYFLRFVKISTDEVRCIGLFTSRDSTALKKDRRLVITLKKHKRLLVEVFAIGEAPLLDWVNPEEYRDSELNVFRAKTLGAKRSAKKLLSYFDIDESDFEKILDGESFEKEYEAITLFAITGENGKVISLKFNETI